jgi:RNA polymerase primary sigma factor
LKTVRPFPQPDIPIYSLREYAQSRDSTAGRGEPFLNPERNAIKSYLQQIGQIALLTPAKEVELARRIRKGDREACKTMVLANLRLVVKIAHDYASFGLPLSDLVSEGNIGLMKAVERFDPDKGGKLSTYAAWWIKQSIKRALANQSKTIRLPVHMVDKIARMRRTAMELSEILGREPNDTELGAELGLSPGKVAHIKSVSVRPASLDAPVGEDEGGTALGEMVGDENGLNPCELLQDKALRRELSAMLDQIEPREADIIRMRFGMDGNHERTLEEVGAMFNITRERVRQLQNLALSKMRKIYKDMERQRTSEQISDERSERGRMDVLRDYIHNMSERE